MSLQSINIGSAPNDGTGDTLRTAFGKVNANSLIVEPVYGHAYAYDDDATVFSVVATVAGTYYPVVGLSNGVVKGAPYLTLSSSVFTLGASGGGVYLAHMRFSIEADKACTLHFDVAKNGSDLGFIGSDTKIANAADVRALGATGIVSLVAGDTVSLIVKSSASTTTIGVRHCSFVLQRLST